ncbi:hypothetical protein, partial [Streptococcus pneumoniae]
KHPLGEKRNHPGSKLRQGFWMVFRFGVNNWGLLYRVWSFFGITFDAHPHSGCFFCLAPNGARQTNSHLIKKRTISKTKKFDIMRHVLN